MGPPSNTSTAAGALQTEVDVKYKYISEGLEQASKSISTLKKQTSSINADLQSAVDLTSSLDDNINNALNNYTNVTASVTSSSIQTYLISILLGTRI